jgi:hypothetical protein
MMIMMTVTKKKEKKSSTSGNYVTCHGSTRVKIIHAVVCT